MIRIEVPGWGKRQIEYLVLDFNGNLALDGKLLEGVDERLAHLSMRLRIHVCTADTFGTVHQQLRNYDVDLKILEPVGQDQQKAELVRSLGPLQTAAVGNGRNDAIMLREAALGVGVIGYEGMSSELVETADVICNDINQALDLLLHPKRLTATLRR